MAEPSPDAATWWGEKAGKQTKTARADPPQGSLKAAPFAGLLWSVKLLGGVLEADERLKLPPGGLQLLGSYSFPGRKMDSSTFCLEGLHT